MAEPSAELEQRVRLAIYAAIVDAGRPPEVADVAARERLPHTDVAAAFRKLADGHIVVLKPGTLQLWSAPPFSGVPTSFRVHIGAASYYAPCAWDMFGIAAALKRDAELDARCAWSGEPLPCTVRGERPNGHGIIHLEVPARRFWDDIFYT